MILKTSKLRVDANSNAGPRKLECGSDTAVSGRQPGSGLSRPRPRRAIRMDSEDAGGATICRQEPPREGTGARAVGQDERPEPGSDHALDPAVPTARKDRPEARAQTTFPHQVQLRRYRSAGPGGPGASAPQRSGHAAHFAARVSDIRPQKVPALSGSFGLAPVQSQSQCRLSPAGHAVYADPTRA